MDSSTPRGPRLWLFRFLAATLIPLAFFVLLEIGLRLGDVGYPTSFFVEGPVPGEWVTNPRFGWRFFPQQIARAPVPMVVPGKAPEDTVRILVVGGSAARGTPEPSLGFANQLEVMLEHVWPETRFEVLNGAMTAINSHVALPIVDDVLDFDLDLVVVYLGNNEVVGPFGASEVLSPFSPHLGWIRTALKIKTLRLGQVLDQALGSTAQEPGEWRGMEMFLDQRIAVDDPGLEGVYGHFRENLVDLIGRAKTREVPVLLSTVAVNLRDQPPFASLHRPDLSAEEKAEFAAHLTVARTLREDPEAALARLVAAEAIDAGFAELHFLRGHGLVQLGRVSEASESFRRARDLDTLRFRADSKINEVIRRVAAEEQILLVDAEESLLAGGGLVDPLPGRKFFHEHVHLNFLGNYVLAKAVLASVGDSLPDLGMEESTVGPPTWLEVADRLAYTPFDAERMEREIFQIVSRPPFLGLEDVRQDLIARRRRLRDLEGLLDEDRWQQARVLFERRLEERPEDLGSRRRFAELLAARGEHEAAAAHWQELVERVPGVLSWYDAWARALVGSGRGEEAITGLEAQRVRFPGQRAEIEINLGVVHERLGNPRRAEEAYGRALEEDPTAMVALYNLAISKAQGGELSAAIDLFRRLVEAHPGFAEGHHNLGVAWERQGDLALAVESYRREMEIRPEDPRPFHSLALVSERQGDRDEAARQYSQALERDPGYAPSLFALADLLVAGGRADSATILYERGLATHPESLRARYNLVLALTAQGLLDKARANLEKGLEVALSHGAEAEAQRFRERLESLDVGVPSR